MNLNYARDFWRHLPQVTFMSYKKDERECEEVSIPSDTFKSVEDFIFYIEKYNYEVISIKKVKGNDTVINYMLPPEEKKED